MVITVRLNEQEENQFKKNLQRSSQTQSKYIKSKLLSPTVSKRTVVQRNSETVSAVAQMNIELQALGVSLSPDLASKFDKVVKGCVCS